MTRVSYFVGKVLLALGVCFLFLSLGAGINTAYACACGGDPACTADTDPSDGCVGRCTTGVLCRGEPECGCRVNSSETGCACASVF